MIRLLMLSMPIAQADENMKKVAVLVGVAGSYNAFSLSLYNLKAYACINPLIKDNWEIPVIQRPLVNMALRQNILPEMADQIIAYTPELVGFSCYMWNMELFRQLAAMILEKSPKTRILFGGPEMAMDYALEGKFDDYNNPGPPRRN